MGRTHTFVGRPLRGLVRLTERLLNRHDANTSPIFARGPRPAEPVQDCGGEVKVSRWTLYVAAGLSLAAALVHLWVTPDHFQEWRGYEAFFLVAALAQGLFGVSLLRWSGKPLLFLGIAGNLAVVAFYVATSTAGLSPGPRVGYTKVTGELDLAATASQAALVMVLVVLLTRARPLAAARLAHRLLAGHNRWVRYGSVAFAMLVAGSTYGATSAQNAQADVPDASLLRDVVNPCFNDSPVGPAFTQDMPIPPKADSVPSSDGTDTYQITEQRSEAEIVPGFKTPIWGYNGIAPGPTIESKKGRPMKVTFTNNLPPGEDPSSIIMTEPPDPEHASQPSSTVVHMHGINASHQDDGYAADGDEPGHKHLRKPPGESQTHFYPNNEYQHQQTMWYHDHSVHITGNHVYRGLAGFNILKDDEEEASGLPGTETADGPDGYGRYDIPLALKDVMIAPKEMKDPVTGQKRPPGTLIYDNCSHMGAFGDVMTMNGKQQPKFDVANRKYRFRLLDASNARQYLLAVRTVPNADRPVDDPNANEPFTVIGSDQGLLRNPEPVTSIHVAPAERLEFMVDFNKYPVGTRLEVVNLLADPQDPKLFPIMAFDVKRTEPDPSRIPPVLRADADPSTPQPDEHPPDLQPPSQTHFIEFAKSNGPYWSINGQIFNPLRDDAKPAINTTEEWILDNRGGGWGHPVHIHLGKFKIVEIDGRAPRPGEDGWKEVVWVGPNQRIRLIHQFWNFPGKFVFHCHNGSHEDFDMMSQFNVQPNP